jgi:hypothetical protein
MRFRMAGRCGHVGLPSVIGYPFAFWVLTAFTVVVGLPRALVRARGRQAVWVSPDHHEHLIVLLYAWGGCNRIAARRLYGPLEAIFALDCDRFRRVGSASSSNLQPFGPAELQETPARFGPLASILEAPRS